MLALGTIGFLPPEVPAEHARHAASRAGVRRLRGLGTGSARAGDVGGGLVDRRAGDTGRHLHRRSRRPVELGPEAQGLGVRPPAVHAAGSRPRTEAAGVARPRGRSICPWMPAHPWTRPPSAGAWSRSASRSGCRRPRTPRRRSSRGSASASSIPRGCARGARARTRGPRMSASCTAGRSCRRTRTGWTSTSSSATWATISHRTNPSGWSSRRATATRSVRTGSSCTRTTRSATTAARSIRRCARSRRPTAATRSTSRACTWPGPWTCATAWRRCRWTAGPAERRCEASPATSSARSATSACGRTC